MSFNKRAMLGDAGTGRTNDVTRYNPTLITEREPILVKDYEEAQEQNELKLGGQLMDLKNDLTDIWGKLDKIINNSFNLFNLKDEYYVNADGWLELQGEIAEMNSKDYVNADPNSLYQMERRVENYRPRTFLKHSKHLESELDQLNGALETMSHIMAHLDVALVTDSVITEDANKDEAPF